MKLLWSAHGEREGEVDEDTSTEGDSGGGDEDCEDRD